MMLSVREPTRTLNHKLRLCLNPTLILFIIAIIIIIQASDSGGTWESYLFAR